MSSIIAGSTVFQLLGCGDFVDSTREIEGDVRFSHRLFPFELYGSPSDIHEGIVVSTSVLVKAHRWFIDADPNMLNFLGNLADSSRAMRTGS